MGDLYIVPTPIGNLEDITLRAIRLLGEVSLIAAEDTRVTRRLLNHLEITTPLTSYHEHNKLKKLDAILDALSEGDVALVSDAGTPGLSDPGYELICAALDHAINVIPLPGASALLPALVASGLPTDHFLYLGFLPRKGSRRRAVIEEIQSLTYTLVFYEAPHRLIDTLADLYQVLGDRQVAVANEISKRYEEFWRGPLSEAAAYFEANPPRGEYVVIVEGGEPLIPVVWSEDQVREAFEAEIASGLSPSKAAKHVAKESGWPRQDVYNLGL